jgi:galactokinase
MTLNNLAAQTTRQFINLYGRQPSWLAAAPGRINLIGEHTDYNDGFVFPMAIERYVAIAADRPSPDTRLIRLYSTHSDKPVIIDLAQPLKPLAAGHWGNYPLGVIAGFLARGLNPGGFDALICSTVPLGGGLSSSAALEVSMATLLETITGKKLDPVEKALLCQKAEHDYAGTPCGIMDQFVSVLGQENRFLLLDCRSQKLELVPMTDPSVAVLVINTNVNRELAGSEYPVRRKQCEAAAKNLGLTSLRDATAGGLEQARDKMDKTVFRRARHVIGENERTVRTAEGVRGANWTTIGQLMYDSHTSLRDDYEVSCPELDAVVEIAKSIGLNRGMYGCRMTGGGFGGCAVALVKADAVDVISNWMAAEYRKKTRIEPTIFVSRPAAGASVLKGSAAGNTPARAHNSASLAVAV